MTTPTSPMTAFPPDLIETAARALYDEAPWVHDGLVIPWADLTKSGKVTFRVQARAVLSVVAGPLRAEGWRLGAEFALRDQGHGVDAFVRGALASHNPFEES